MTRWDEIRSAVRQAFMDEVKPSDLVRTDLHEGAAGCVADRAANALSVRFCKLDSRIAELESALKAAAHLLHGEDIDPDGTRSDEFMELANRGSQP